MSDGQDDAATDWLGGSFAGTDLGPRGLQRPAPDGHRSSLTLNNTHTSGGDFAKTYSLFSSRDGVTFSNTAFATFSGSANKSTVTFTPESLRAVRVPISDTGGNSAYWSIGEIQVGCSL
jgi:hypothetical protein